MDSAAIKRTDMLRGGHRGREVPIYRGGTGGTDKPELIGTRTTAGTGVIQGRLQGRKATPDKPAKKSLYAGKITPGVTGKEGRAKFFAARAARREDSSTDLRTQLMYILADKLDEVNKPRLNVPDPTDRPKREPVPTEPVKPPKPLAKYHRPKSNKPPVTEELKARIAHILDDKIDEIAKITPKPKPREIMKGPKKPPVKPGAPGSRSAEVLEKWKVGKK